MTTLSISTEAEKIEREIYSYQLKVVSISKYALECENSQKLSMVSIMNYYISKIQKLQKELSK